MLAEHRALHSGKSRQGSPVLLGREHVTFQVEKLWVPTAAVPIPRCGFEGLCTETPRCIRWVSVSVQKSVASPSPDDTPWRVPPHAEPSLQPEGPSALLRSSSPGDI